MNTKTCKSESQNPEPCQLDATPGDRGSGQAREVVDLRGCVAVGLGSEFSFLGGLYLEVHG